LSHQTIQTSQGPFLKGDCNDNGALNISDIVDVQQWTYLLTNSIQDYTALVAKPVPPSPVVQVIPTCVADLNGDGNPLGFPSPSDVVLLINGVYQLPAGCPLCLRPCI